MDDVVTLRDALVNEYHQRMHEDDCSCRASFIADPVNAIIAAVRADERRLHESAYDEAAESIHAAFCNPDEQFGPWDRDMADALLRRGLSIVRADATHAVEAEVAGLREALASWVREDPWVPSVWSKTNAVIQWECYACEATITLPPRPLSLTGPDEAWHIDGTGREERCRWLVARAALAATCGLCGLGEDDNPEHAQAVAKTGAPYEGHVFRSRAKRAHALEATK